jgi:hypothetical protein
VAAELSDFGAFVFGACLRREPLNRRLDLGLGGIAGEQSQDANLAKARC